MLSYGFYNSKGGDRKYDAEQFGAMFNGLITDGIFAHYKDALKVTAGSGNRELVVKPGRAWFNGTWTEVDDNGHSIYLFGSAVETTYFVYLAVNKLDRKNTIAWYNSIANNNPEKGLYFYLLAQVTVPGRVTKISDSMITDTRGSDLCPYVTLWLDRCENVGGSGPGQNVDLTGYAKEEWVQNNYQPKGDYLTSAPVTSVNGRTGKVLLRAPDVGAMPAETEIPGKTSELTNDSGFIDKAVSDLKNYYTKAQTQELIAQIPTFQVLVVQQLPTTGAEKTLYLVPFASDGGNYAEYLWANGAWELLGTPHVDLTGYATEEWVQEMLAGKTGAYLPMPKAYNAGEWVFVEEVDGKGNVSKTGTKVLDWVATHTSRVDPSDQVLVPEVTLQTGITNAFGYDTLAGQTEVLVVCDGKLHLCNVEFGYSEGDGYFYHLGNKSLFFQATDTGEPFFFHGYKGTSTMAHFSTAGEHTVEIYGGKEVLIYNKMPEEYLPDGVVRTVNGVAPDENGNVNVDGVGSGQTRYYASLSAAVTDINNGVWDNALTDISTAKTKVFTAHTGALTVMLMDDVDESVQVDISKDIDLVLNGKALNLITAAAVLTFGVGTKCRINGEVVGSSIVMDGVSATANTAMITTNGDLLEIHGGEYRIHMNNTERVSCIVAGESCGKFLMGAANMHAYNDGGGQCRILQSQAKKSLIENVHGIGVSASIVYGIFMGGDMEVRNSEINVRGGMERAIAVSTYGGFDFKINDSRLLAVSNAKKAIAILTTTEVRTYAENTYMFTDSPDCHSDSGNHAVAVLSQGETHLTNCVCVGTHSAAHTLSGTLYINGGTYTGFCHGGVYVGGTEGKPVYINDATLRCGNYEGEFDYSGKTSEIYGSVYIGGRSDANGLSAYLDGCVITNEGGHSIVMRGTDGEHDNAVYISNSTVLGTIRIDNDTLKLYVGVGTDITTDKVDNPTRAAFDGKLYRRLDPGREATGADWEALRAYVEASFA